MKLKTKLTSIARLSKWKDPPPRMVGDPHGGSDWRSWGRRCDAVYEHEMERKRHVQWLTDHGDDEYRAALKVERALKKVMA